MKQSVIISDLSNVGTQHIVSIVHEGHSYLHPTRTYTCIYILRDNSYNTYKSFY